MAKIFFFLLAEHAEKGLSVVIVGIIHQAVTFAIVDFAFLDDFDIFFFCVSSLSLMLDTASLLRPRHPISMMSEPVRWGR